MGAPLLELQGLLYPVSGHWLIELKLQKAGDWARGYAHYLGELLDPEQERNIIFDNLP